MGEDAQGILLYLLPYLLGINIFIVNIDTSNKADRFGKKYQVNEHKSELPGGFRRTF